MSPLSHSETKAEYQIQIVFTSGCPCFQRMTSHMSELIREYKDQGFAFELYDVGSKDQATAKKVAGIFKLDAPVFEDHKLEMAHKLGAEISPTVYVWQGKKLLYSGAVMLESAKDSHLQKPLEQALIALKNKKPVQITSTTAEGCFLISDIQ